MMMDRPQRPPGPKIPTVAILGGGFCGAATAFHLARQIPPGAARIVVIEPRAEIGRGLAYDTNEPAHRINVPAARMTLVSEDPAHFTSWLTRARIAMSPGTVTPRGDLFPEREIFGRYVAAHLAPLLASGVVEHHRASATAVHRQGTGYVIALSDGTRLTADLVTLAMSHPLPGLPAELRGLTGSPRLVADPYDSARLAEIPPGDSVLVVGTGLTSSDVIASLRRRGFRGRITALSRRGLRSRGHAPTPRTSDADFSTDPCRTALGLLRRVRAAVAADVARGFTWHAALNQMRDQGQAAWAALDLDQRARLTRHLRVFWDVHRFRIAPQVEEVLDAEVARGNLSYRAARLISAEETPDGIRVTLHPRGAAEPVTETFDTIIVTTGPSHGGATRANPALRTLAEDGLITPDALGLGLSVTGLCHAIDAEGRASDTLLVVGPLARGHVGELMGVPEVTRHAETTAATLAKQLAAMGQAVGTPPPLPRDES